MAVTDWLQLRFITKLKSDWQLLNWRFWEKIILLEDVLSENIPRGSAAVLSSDPRENTTVPKKAGEITGNEEKIF